MKNSKENKCNPTERWKEKNTRTKTVMAKFNTQNKIQSILATINSNKAVNTNHDNMILLETEQNKATSIEKTIGTNTNNIHKIKFMVDNLNFIKCAHF
jgi:hypothetical protein